MASFFSDLGKQFQNAAKSVQKMTKDGLEATRLNGEIRALRDEQKKLLLTLGEAYYEARGKADAAEQLDLIVKRIDQINERARDISTEIDALNDRRRCVACSETIAKDAKFCPSCGARQPEPEPEPEPAPEPEPEPEPEAPAAEFCSECGALKQEEARFCEVCGHSFAPEPSKPEVEITWPEAGAEAPAEEPAEEHSEEE